MTISWIVHHAPLRYKPTVYLRHPKLTAQHSIELSSLKHGTEYQISGRFMSRKVEIPQARPVGLPGRGAEAPTTAGASCAEPSRLGVGAKHRGVFFQGAKPQVRTSCMKSKRRILAGTQV